MASGGKEALQDSDSDAMAGTKQLQQTGQLEEGEDDQCAICLDTIDNRAYIELCFHAFCYRCILQWAAERAECPVCRLPFSLILHTVRADNDYNVYVVRSSNRHPAGARQRVRSRSLQHHYQLRSRPNNNNNHESTGRRRIRAQRD